MRKKQIKKEMENLKFCVEAGHDYEFQPDSPYGRPHIAFYAEWICKRCGFVFTARLTKEQCRVVERYKALKPKGLPIK